MKCFAVVAAWVGMLVGAGICHAHGVETGYTYVTVAPGRLDVTVAFNLADLAVHRPMDRDQDQRLGSEELEAAGRDLSAFTAAHFTVAVNGAPIALEPQPVRLTADASGQEFFQVPFIARLSAPAHEVAVTADVGLFETFQQTYTNLVVLTGSDGQVQQAPLSLQQPTLSFALGVPASRTASAVRFLRLGIQHIFLGYDHIMFLIALLAFGGRLLTLVKIVSAFTIAHSITLILAALQVVHLPPRLIESAIALSIIYVAAENFFLTRADHRWMITFLFGLVHGFGFANVLRELGLPATGLIASLLSFNVGVEFGQLTIVALLWPVMQWVARQRFHRAAVAAVSGVILLCGLGWFLERACGLRLMPF